MHHLDVPGHGEIPLQTVSRSASGLTISSVPLAIKLQLANELKAY